MAASKMAGHCSEGSITHSFILSAIDVHDGSLHPARLIRTEEGYYLRDIGWFSQANYPKLADRAFDVLVDGDTPCDDHFSKSFCRREVRTISVWTRLT